MQVEQTRLQEKRTELEAELQKGQALLQRQQADLERTRVTMMHIQGALTLLQELLAEETQEPKIIKLERVKPQGKDGQGDAEVPAPLS